MRLIEREKLNVTEAVILAAGQGTHLWPYNETHAKAALPVGNRPLIHHQLDALESVGIEQVWVVTGYLEGNVRAACHEWLDFSTSGMGVQIVPAANTIGTACSARAGLLARTDPQAPVVIVPGDLLFHPRDLVGVLSNSFEDEITCLVSQIDKNYCQDGISADVAGHHIKAIHAHSRWCSSESRAWTGLVVLPAGSLEDLVATPEFPTCIEIGAMPSREQALFETIHQLLRRDRKVNAWEAVERVVDIDRPWDIIEANTVVCDWLTGGLAENQLAEGASIDPSARLEGHVALGEGSLIGPGVIVYGNLVVGRNTIITDGAYIGGNIVIGDNCKIWRGCLIESRSVIGHRCVVGHGAEFEGVMMDESYSFHYGEYWGILGRCCDLGAATVCGTLRFDDGQTSHRVKGRREVPRWHANATYLGDYVRTGVNVTLMPGVKVGAYSLVGAGVLLQEDLPSRTSIFIEQTCKRSTWGPERYGW
ncbi:MAG: NTP transferase domain-containing protein [Candidatus Omnitrophica bacterium]|nr:NTP transferase domain-containing protein [Candidatus Omnitrophota bacterium]